MSVAPFISGGDTSNTLASIPKLTLEIVGKGRPPERREVQALRTIIGRESGDIVLHDSETSALHAEIDCSQGHVIVRDLGSSNGTWRDGKRLPQFALYEGQSFHCGGTEIRLVALEGSDGRPKAGQTAVGEKSEVLGSAGTLARGSAPASARTLLGSPSTAGDPPSAPPPGWQPPSKPTEGVPALGSPAPLAKPTHVGTSNSSGTLAGMPGSAPPSSTATLPAGDTADNVGAFQPPALPGENADPGGTMPAGDVDQVTGVGQAATIAGPGLGEAPTVAGHPAPASEAAPSTEAAPAVAAVPTAMPAAGSGGIPLRGPVANAVIKNEGAGGQAPATAARRTGSSGVGRVIAFLGLGLVAAAALGGLAYFVYVQISARSMAFTEELARELPQDAIGLYAISSPEDVLGLLGDEIPDEVRTHAAEQFKFDPFDLDAWEGLGIDPSAPAGASLLSYEKPIAAFSVGVSDRDKVKDALGTVLAQHLAQEQLHWAEREWGKVPGLWLEEPFPAAALFRGDRLTIIAPLDGPVVAEDIERAAEAMADLKKGTTLADRPGFAGIAPPKGNVLSATYIDGASLRAAIPGAGVGMMAVRMALADIDGFLGAISYDDSDIHVTYEMIVREGSRHLELLDGEARKPDALDKIQAPVLAEFDAAFNPDAFDRGLGGAASFAGESLTFFESGLREELGIDLRADITQNLSGRMGFALLSLPTARDKDDLSAIAWVGVKDEAKAKSAAERVYAKAHDGFGMRLEEVGGVTTYKIPPPDPETGREYRMFIHEGYLWAAMGPVDVATLIRGPDTPFRKDARHKAIKTAVKKGSHAAGFIDIKSVIQSVRPLLREGDQEELDGLSPILSLFEVASVRTDREGRAIVARGTIHTNADDGLATVTQAVMKHAGVKVAAQLAAAARAKRCAALAEHIVGLTKDALTEAKADLNHDWDIETQVLEHCPKISGARLDCYMKTASMAELVECDSKTPAEDDGGKVAEEGGGEAGDDGSADDGGEPRPVPYVDDIWPHLSDDPDSDRPQPEVNYAVPLGPDPQSRGAENALVTIIEFGDFQCPHCRAVTKTIDEVLADHGKDVRFVFRHHPLENLHTDARKAAKAGIAAAKQGKFFKMHDKLFANQSGLNEANFRRFAEEIGLDVTEFDRDYYDAETDRRLQRDIEAAEKFGAAGTPAFFVNGRYIGGAQTKAAFEVLIKEELERAKKFVERRGNTRKRLYEDMTSHFAPEVLKPRTIGRAIDPDEKRYILGTTGLPSKGAEGFARVQLIQCGDFDCPYCARVRPVIDKLLKAYPTQITFFFAHDPLGFHHGAEPAARAAVAADNQGKFWEMHDLLYEEQGSTARTEADYVGYAKKLKLNIGEFKKDFAAAETAAKVEEQRKLCVDNDATATPTFFINGARIEGAQEFDRFKALVDGELAAGI